MCRVVPRSAGGVPDRRPWAGLRPHSESCAAPRGWFGGCDPVPLGSAISPGSSTTRRPGSTQKDVCLHPLRPLVPDGPDRQITLVDPEGGFGFGELDVDRKSTRLNSSHLVISYAVFCLKKKKKVRSHHILERWVARSSRVARCQR